MLKKTVMCLSALLLSRAALADTLVYFELEGRSGRCPEACLERVRNSVIIPEGQKRATCQLDDLEFEVVMVEETGAPQIHVDLDILRNVDGVKTAITKIDFSTELDKAAELKLEKDGNELRLTVVIEKVSPCSN